MSALVISALDAGRKTTAIPPQEGIFQRCKPLLDTNTMPFFSASHPFGLPLAFLSSVQDRKKEERPFFCIKMPKILISRVLASPSPCPVLDQASGSALIPPEQQKKTPYRLLSKSHYFPETENFGCPFPSRLEGFVSLNSPNPFKAEPAPRSLGTGLGFGFFSSLKG